MEERLIINEKEQIRPASNSRSLMLKEKQFKNETVVTFYTKSNNLSEKRSWTEQVYNEERGWHWSKLWLSKETNLLMMRPLELSDVKNTERSSRARTRNSLHEKLRLNEFEWFVTLTFDPRILNSMDLDEVIVFYRKFMRVISKRCPNARYVAVPERHKGDKSEEGNTGAYHIHMVLGGVCPHELEFVNSGKETNKGQPIYNIMSYVYGYSTVTLIENKEATNYYIQKYVGKNIGDVTDKNKKRFYASRNLKKVVTERVCLSSDYSGDGIHIENSDIVNHAYFKQAKFKKENKVPYYHKESGQILYRITNVQVLLDNQSVKWIKTNADITQKAIDIFGADIVKVV